MIRKIFSSPASCSRRLGVKSRGKKFFLFPLSSSIFFFVICYLLFAISTLHAQTATLSGTCSLPDTSDWSGITIAIDGQNLSATTNASGQFFIGGIQFGSITIKAGKVNYADTSAVIFLAPGANGNIALALSKNIVETLQGVRMANFSSASTNTGNIGIPNLYISASDSGFRWAGVQQLKEASIMLGTAPGRVSDAARTIFAINQDNLDRDFKALSGVVTLTSGPDSMVQATSFDDSNANEPPGSPSAPLGIVVTQKTSVYHTGTASNYMLVEMRIHNTTRFDITNFIAGWFIDWEAGGTGATNRGAVITATQQYDGANNGVPFPIEIAYQRASTSSGPYMGVVPLSQAMFKSARILSVGQEVVPLAPNHGLTENNKYDFMKARRVNAASTDWGIEEDLATIVSVGGLSGNDLGSSTYTIPANGEITVGFGFVAGADSAEMIANALAAQQAWLAHGNAMLIYPSTWFMPAGWRLISVPLLSDDMTKSALFPWIATNAFAYVHNVGYSATDVLQPGVGYWLKFPADTLVTLYGSLIRTDTVDVQAGWDLLGAASFPILVANLVTIPPNIISSGVFGFTDHYTAVTKLEPLQSYWVKFKQPGKVILQTSQ